MTTCTHPGEPCEDIRVCEEPGCKKVIFSGFSIEGDCFCNQHFALTDEEFEEFGDTCYWTDWEVVEQCYDCHPDCECMAEARKLKTIDDKINEGPWIDAPVRTFIVDGHTVEAVGQAHATSIYHTNPSDERVKNV